MADSDWVDVPVAAPVSSPEDWQTVSPTPTTILDESRNQVIQAPASMDEDELRYSVATQIDKKPKEGFFGMLDVGVNVLSQLPKGFANFLATTGVSTLGSLVKETGETLYSKNEADRLAVEAQTSLSAESKAETLAKIQSFGLMTGKMSLWGKELAGIATKLSKKMSTERPADGSAAKLSYDVGAGFGSVAASVGAAYLTKNPAAIATAFALIQKGQIYEEGRAAGKTPQESSDISTVAAIPEGVLELTGLHVFMEAVKVSKPLARVAVRTATEIIQEMSQQTAEEVITSATNIRPEDAETATKNILYAGLIAAFSSAPVAHVTTTVEDFIDAKDILDQNALNHMMLLADATGTTDLLMRSGATREQAEMFTKTVTEKLVANGAFDEGVKILEHEVSPMVHDDLETTEEKTVPTITPAPAGQFDHPAFVEQVDQILKNAEKEGAHTLELVETEKINARYDYLSEKVAQLEHMASALEQAGGLRQDTATQVAKIDKQLSEIYPELYRLQNAITFSKEDKTAIDKGKIQMPGAKFGRIMKTAVAGKIQSLREGLRKGRQIALKEAKVVQQEVIRLVTESDLGKEDKADFLKSLPNLQTTEQLDRKLASIAEKVAFLEDRAESKGIREKIGSLLAATKPTMENGHPVGKYTPEIQNFLDKLRGIFELTQSQARQLLDTRLEVQEDLPSDLEVWENQMLALAAGQMKPNRIDFALGDTPVGKLTTLAKDLEALISTGRAENLLKVLEREAALKQMADSALQSIEGSKPSSGFKEPITNWQKKLAKFHQGIKGFGKSFIMGWDQIMDILSQDDNTSKAEKSLLSEIAHVGRLEAKEVGDINRRIKAWVEAEVLRIYQLKNARQLSKLVPKWSQPIDLGTFIDASGKSRQLVMSLSQIRKLWMVWQDETQQERITHPEGNAFTVEMLNHIFYVMDAKDLELAKAELKFFKDYFNPINSVYSEMYGVELPFNEDYSPVRVDGVKESPELNAMKQEIELRRGLLPGSGKSRVKNVRPIRLDDDFQTMIRHVHEWEHFMAWAQKYKELRAIFSDQRVRDSITRKYGDNMLGIIDTYMLDFRSRGRRTAGAYEGALNFLNSVYIVNALGGLKAAQFVKQLTGAAAFLEFYETPTQFAEGIADLAKNPIQKIRDLHKNSPYLQQRFGTLLTDIEEAFRSREGVLALEKPSFKRLNMFFFTQGDRASIILGGYPIYYRVLKQTGSAEKAIAAFETAALKTQPSTYTSELTEFQRGGVVNRMAARFTSAQAKYLQRELGAIRNALNGRMSYKDAAKVIAIHHFVLPALYQWAADFGKWREDEQFRAMMLGPLNGAFLFMDLIEGLSRIVSKEVFGKDVDIFNRSSSIILSNTVAGITKGLQDIDWEDILWEDVMTALKDVSLGVAKDTVVAPTKLVTENIPSGMKDLEEGEIGKAIGKFLGWSPYTIDKVSSEE